jgi:hypothetical protein
MGTAKETAAALIDYSFGPGGSWLFHYHWQYYLKPPEKPKRTVGYLSGITTNSIKATLSNYTGSLF